MLQADLYQPRYWTISKSIGSFFPVHATQLNGYRILEKVDITLVQFDFFDTVITLPNKHVEAKLKSRQAGQRPEERWFVRGKCDAGNSRQVSLGFDEGRHARSHPTLSAFTEL